MKQMIINWILGIGLTSALAYITKSLPLILEKDILEKLNWLFTNGDAADKIWLKATIDWAEAKYGPGTGAQKAMAVVNKIISLLPVQYRFFVNDKVKGEAVKLFQNTFDGIEKTVVDAPIPK